MDPFVDVLVDINENKEYEFRTTHNHNHIAKAFIASCAVRLLRNPALYWDFVSCINEYFSVMITSVEKKVWLPLLRMNVSINMDTL